MITKNDWDAAHAAVLAQARERLGPPPTDDELDAYREGRLPEQEAERIEELLAVYPEFARAIAIPFPTDDVKPGDAGYLSDEALEADWTSLRARIARESSLPLDSAQPRESSLPLESAQPREIAQSRETARPRESAPPREIAQARETAQSRETAQPPRAARVIPFSRVRELVAIAAAITFAVLFFHAQYVARRQQSEPRINVVVARAVDLEPNAARGSGNETIALTLPAEGDEIPLRVLLTNQALYPDYALEIVAVDGTREHTAWRSGEGVRRFEDDTLSIVIPRRFLAPGIYHLDAYGLRGAEKTKIGTFPIRMPAWGSPN